jgi:hypothetical protein
MSAHLPHLQGANEYQFDLQADPKEKNNLAGKRPEGLSRYGRVLDDWQRGNEKTAEKVGGAREEYREDEQLRKHLEELGYM